MENIIIKNTIWLMAFLSLTIFGQETIEVTDKTIKLGAMADEEIYFGFAEGDKLIFDFEELKGKELKEIEIIEMPGSSRFMDYKTKRIKEKVIDVKKTGIYKFRFSNSSLAGRICKFKIHRIPLNESTRKFDTEVYWKTILDTSYTPKQEKYLVKSDTSALEIYSSSPQISSTNALNGNKNYQIVDFVLPENTISWSFYIGTGNEGKAAYDKAMTNFTESAVDVVSKIPNYGALAALALTGVSYFNKVQGQDNVKYWFLSDANSVNLFNTGQEFYQYKKGDVVTEASQMKTPLKGKIYLALLNDNTIDPIKLTIKVTVIQVNQIWNTRTIQIMDVTNKQVPYLKVN